MPVPGWADNCESSVWILSVCTGHACALRVSEVEWCHPVTTNIDVVSLLQHAGVGISSVNPRYHTTDIMRNLVLTQKISACIYASWQCNFYNICVHTCIEYSAVCPQN